MTDAEAITKTIGEYCQLYDDRRFDEFREIWVEDAVFRVRDIIHRGRDNVRKFIEGLSYSSNQRGVHGSFNPVIEIDGDSAKAHADYIWFGVVDGKLHVGSGGRYNFSLVRNSDRWRISELEVRLLLTPEETGG
jgi:ketosteroid isomerase-like protein